LFNDLLRIIIWNGLLDRRLELDFRPFRNTDASVPSAFRVLSVSKYRLRYRFFKYRTLAHHYASWSRVPPFRILDNGERFYGDCLQ